MHLWLYYENMQHQTSNLGLTSELNSLLNTTMQRHLAFIFPSPTVAPSHWAHEQYADEDKHEKMDAFYGKQEQKHQF